MNILDKFCLGLVCVTAVAVTYDDIAERFEGLFEANAETLKVGRLQTQPKHSFNICEHDDIHHENCIDTLEIALSVLENKPSMPLGYIPSDKHINCLAQNIYQEAGIESLEGKVAVAYGTIQRVKNGGFYKKNLCGAIFQKAWDKDKGKWVAQMSWTLNRRKVNMPTPPIYRTIALDVLKGKYKHPDLTCPFTNWHNPIDTKGNFNADQWNKGKTKCTRTIGRHTYIAFK